MIIWAENWQGYGAGGSFGTALLTDGLYASVGEFQLAVDPDPTVDTRVFKFFSAQYDTSIRKVFPGGAYTKVGQAYRSWVAGLPEDDDDVAFAEFRNVGNQVIASLNIMNDGRLRFTVPGGPAVFTDIPVVTANAWWHIEILIDFAGIANNVEVRVEGVPVLKTTQVFANNCGQVSFYTKVTGEPFWYVKDWVVYNGEGAYNTDFLGSVTVFDLYPDADVSMNWASTGPNGFGVLDNDPPDDAQYISASDPPPPASVFNLSDLPPYITSVRGIVTITRARKIDGGDGSLQVSLVSEAGPEAPGLDRNITAAFTYFPDVFEEDPSTNAPWLPNALNAAKLKLNRTL